MTTNSVTVLKQWNAMTLIDVLSQAFGISNKKAKSLLDRKSVIVNGRRVWMAKYVVHTGDVLQAIFDSEQTKPAGESSESAPTKVYFEDEYFLIVEKPSGMVTNGAGSFEERLVKELKNKALRAVHRLDRDTSGLLIVAKTKKVFDAFVELFKAGGLEKKYQGIILGGILSKDAPLVIDTPLEGKSAYTEVQCIKHKDAVSLATIQIQTGRTHQIRKHLFSKGMQILGDREYEIKRAANSVFREVPRQMLHASFLQFKHPVTQQKVACTSPFPKDFKSVLKTFQLSE